MKAVGLGEVSEVVLKDQRGVLDLGQEGVVELSRSSKEKYETLEYERLMGSKKGGPLERATELFSMVLNLACCGSGLGLWQARCAKAPLFRS